MSKTDIQLVTLINEGKSINEICEHLMLSRNKVYKKLLNLKNNGYTILREYCYNGDIYYKQINDTINQNENSVTIKMEENENKFTAVVISDLHIGCDKQRLDLLDQIYDYCINNNINIILNTGDIVDGWFGQNKKINKNIELQLEYLLKKYPFDKNILNFICLGNHDVDSLKNFGINLKTLLNNYRHDLVAFASERGIVNIKNDKIVLCHQLGNNQISHSTLNNSIILEGHHHKFSTSFNHVLKNNLIFVPSLSDIYINKYIPLASALVINFDLENGLFTHGVISQLISNGNNFVKINEIKFCNLHTKNKTSQANHSQINNEKTTTDQENLDKPKAYNKNDEFERMMDAFNKQDKLHKKYKYE